MTVISSCDVVLRITIQCLEGGVVEREIQAYLLPKESLGMGLAAKCVMRHVPKVEEDSLKSSVLMSPWAIDLGTKFLRVQTRTLTSACPFDWG